jgi:hypothetical protein
MIAILIENLGHEPRQSSCVMAATAKICFYYAFITYIS